MKTIINYFSKLMAYQSILPQERANKLNNPAFMKSLAFKEKVTQASKLFEDQEIETKDEHALRDEFIAGYETAAMFQGKHHTRFSELIASFNSSKTAKAFVYEKPQWQTAYEHLMSVYYSLNSNENLEVTKLSECLKDGLAPEIVKCIELLVYSYWQTNRYGVVDKGIDLQLIASNTLFYCVTSFSPLKHDDLLTFIRWKFKNNVLSTLNAHKVTLSIEQSNEQHQALKLENRLLETEDLYDVCSGFVSFIVNENGLKLDTVCGVEQKDEHKVHFYREDARSLVHLAVANLIAKLENKDNKLTEEKIEILKQMLYGDNFANREIMGATSFSENQTRQRREKVMAELKEEVQSILTDYPEDFLL